MSVESNQQKPIDNKDKTGFINSLIAVNLVNHHAVAGTPTDEIEQILAAKDLPLPEKGIQVTVENIRKATERIPKAPAGDQPAQGTKDHDLSSQG